MTISNSRKNIETEKFLTFLFDLLSFWEISPFILLVALCSANLRLSKSLVEVETFGAKLDFTEVPLLKFKDVLEPKDLLKLPLFIGLTGCFSITTVFFP